VHVDRRHGEGRNSNRLPDVWDEQTPRGQSCVRLVKQVCLIALIIIAMFPVCDVRVTLCYMCNLSGSVIANVCTLYFDCRLRHLSLCPLAAASS
jgi:hypothetical protein